MVHQCLWASAAHMCKRRGAGSALELQNVWKIQQAFYSVSQSLHEKQQQQQTQKSLPTLLCQGPDQRGIVASCVDLLNRHEFAVVASEHFTANRDAVPWFFQRIQFECQQPNESSSNNNNTETNQQQQQQARETLLEQELEHVATRFSLEVHVDWNRSKKRVAILVSKYDHCLWELLLRWQSHELHCADIVVVISNHPDLQSVAETFRLPFEVAPVCPDTKKEQTQQLLHLFKKYKVDVILLARYMQIIANEILEAYPGQIINIHHSFLPAFRGGSAYHQAHARGVKLIGATAHYATEDLDEGPIIEQDVISVKARDNIKDFIEKGRMVERKVLCTAVQAHLDNRVLVHNNKCFVFTK